jgi:lipoprotein-anchoring transpeptidase ErfK/SrfK
MPYPWIQQANPGVSDGLFVGQTLTIPSPDELLPLPVVANKRIVVSISQQRMWAYENGTLVWDWPTSTGIDESPTSPGVFQIQTHETNAYAGNWNLWMPYFMGIYRPVPTSDFMNGFHGFPTRDGQNLLWTSSLGHQVTYGCLLVSTDNARLLYDWAEAGVVVEIQS